MITIDISGFGSLAIRDLVLDFNGTIAFDGSLISGVANRIHELAESLTIHVLTADTTGTCRQALAGLPLSVTVLDRRPEDEAKLAFVEKLGKPGCACIGNGMNDALMLQASALGIAVMGAEGSAGKALAAADVVCPDINAALDLLLQPVRLRATLRT